MTTVDVVYAWGNYGGSNPWTAPIRVPKLGTGGNNPLGACTQVNGEAGWFTFLVGGIPYGLGNNTGNKLSQTGTNPYSLNPVALGAATDTGVSGLVAAGATFPIIQCDGGDTWCWALDSAGKVWAIGSSSSGVLGNNGPGPQVPTIVPGIGGTGTITLSAADGAISGGSGHAIGLQAAGTVIGCGGNTFGELGNNNLGTNSSTPVQVLGGAQGGTNLSNIIAVSVGNKQSLALEANTGGGTGRVFAWGMGTLGQLGNNGTANEAVPVLVDFAAAVGGTVTIPIIAISGGGGSSGVDGQSFFIDSAGLLWATGANTYGQLGLGTTGTPNFTSQYTVPQLVNIPLSGGQTVVKAASGARHGIALRSDGALFVWGDNTAGELGNPALNTAIPGISGAIGTSVPTQLTLNFPSSPTFNLIWAGNQTTTVDLSYTIPAATGSPAASRPGPGLMVA